MVNFILSKLLILVTIFSINLSTPVDAIPPIKNKTQIELDISGELPKSIRALPSEEHPGGIHYVMKKNYRSNLLIGTIIDAGQFIAGGDDKNTSRCVLVLFRENGSKYVRVMNNYPALTSGGYSKTIEEYVRKFCEFFYRKVNRDLIKLDVVTQDNNHLIHVEVVVPPELESTYMEDAVLSDLTEVPVKFSIQPDMIDDVVIGTVKYGRYIVNDMVEGLLERSVIWEGGIADPKITIGSCYSIGECSTDVYVFDPNEGEFFLRSTRKRILHL